MKPGALTTEFWLSVATVVAATVLACVSKVNGDVALGVIGTVTTGYGISRGVAKVNAPAVAAVAPVVVDPVAPVVA